MQFVQLERSRRRPGTSLGTRDNRLLNLTSGWDHILPLNQPHHTAHLLFWLRCLVCTISLQLKSTMDRSRVRRISASGYWESWWRLLLSAFPLAYEYLLSTTSLPGPGDERTPSSTVFRQIRMRSLYPIDKAEGTYAVTSHSAAALMALRSA